MEYEEFLAAMSPKMNRARRALVSAAFDKFDKDGSGQVNQDDLEDLFDAKKDPRVKAGQKTQREVLNEFLSAFEVGGTVDGIVTREEFM
jgi:Ca2+-binding EF-hand superfamily protein